jgi:hypothetical protein
MIKFLYRIQSLIDERLPREMRNLELFLRDSADNHVLSMIDDGAEESKIFYAGSGDTFKWVSLLRAADVFWSSCDSKDAEVTVPYKRFC